MKTLRNISTQNPVLPRSKMSGHHVTSSTLNISSGSVADKYPVSFDGGKTIIFISGKSKEEETRQRYELQVSNRFIKYSKKAKA